MSTNELSDIERAFIGYADGMLRDGRAPDSGDFAEHFELDRTECSRTLRALIMRGYLEGQATMGDNWTVTGLTAKGFEHV